MHEGNISRALSYLEALNEDVSIWTSELDLTITSIDKFQTIWLNDSRGTSYIF
jgi:hypothetical protein